MTRLFAGTPFDRPPVCDSCGELQSACVCPPAPIARNLIPPARQTARLNIEKRRKGKTVTVIRGLAADANDLPALLRNFKTQCGAGGTIDGDVIEIQGDHLERLKGLLAAAGYAVQARD